MPVRYSTARPSAVHGEMTHSADRRLATPQVVHFRWRLPSAPSYQGISCLPQPASLSSLWSLACVVAQHREEQGAGSGHQRWLSSQHHLHMREARGSLSGKRCELKACSPGQCARCAHPDAQARTLTTVVRSAATSSALGAAPTWARCGRQAGEAMRRCASGSGNSTSPWASTAQTQRQRTHMIHTETWAGPADSSLSAHS